MADVSNEQILQAILAQNEQIADLQRRLASAEQRAAEAEARAKSLQQKVDAFAKGQTQKLPENNIPDIPKTKARTGPPKATKNKRIYSPPPLSKTDGPVKEILEDYKSVLGQRGTSHQINDLLESKRWPEIENYIKSSNWMKALMDEYDGYVPTNGVNMPAEGYYKMLDLIESLYDDLEMNNLID